MGRNRDKATLSRQTGGFARFIMPRVFSVDTDAFDAPHSDICDPSPFYFMAPQLSFSIEIRSKSNVALDSNVSFWGPRCPGGRLRQVTFFGGHDILRNPGRRSLSWRSLE